MRAALYHLVAAALLVAACGLENQNGGDREGGDGGPTANADAGSEGGIQGAGCGAERQTGQDLIDLGWHQKEFQTRRSFAYTVVTPSESHVIGCVYIDPTRRSGFDAEVFLWARQSELAGGLEARLYRTVQEWIQTDWPFKSVAFPGRDIDWPAWRAIPLEAR
jgi:hypothetical protein